MSAGAWAAQAIEGERCGRSGELNHGGGNSPANAGAAPPMARSRWRPEAGSRTTHSQLERHPLRERQVAPPVDRVRLPAHVGLPGVGAGLAPATGFLLATKRATDLGARRPDVHVGD